MKKTLILLVIAYLLSGNSFGQGTLPLGVTGIPTNVLCAGDCNGMIDITITGGTTPYSYIWSNTALTQNISDLCPGVYTVTLTDASLTSVSASWLVDEPGELSWQGIRSDVTCFGLCNGTITTSFTLGGTPPYAYHWSNGATTPNLTGLCSGNYFLTVSDSHNCDVRPFTKIFQPANIGLNATTLPAGCPGSGDGSINLTVSGGAPPYTYYWSNSATTRNISNLNADIYCVTVTDFHSCTKTGCWPVTQTSPVCTNLFLQNDEVHDSRCVNATQTIYVAGLPPDFLTTFVVATDGQIEMIAGQNIIYYPGTYIAGGMWGHIAPEGPYCGGFVPSMVTLPAGEETTTAGPVQPGFKIYPNPSNGSFTLEQNSDTQYVSLIVEVYGIRGEKLLAANVTGEKKHEFRLPELPAGPCFIKVFANDHMETFKLVIIKQ